MTFSATWLKFSAVCALALSMLVPAATFAQRQTISGSGNYKKETRSAASGFEKIASSGKFKVYITQSSTPSIEVEAEDNLLPYIETEIGGNALKLRYKDGYNLRPEKEIIVRVSTAAVKELAASGIGGFYSTGRLKGDELEVAISGRGDASLDLDYNKLELSISGSGKADLKGTSRKVEISISGSGDVAAKGMRSQEMEVNISGSGKAEVNVDKTLEVAVSGSGTVNYMGSAKVSQSVSGKAQIKSIN
ncbi:head GIN domain-containing protein [Chitinophaga lutea]